LKEDSTTVEIAKSINLFSIAYFPPVSYIRECLRFSSICLDAHEHFVKQTYRNRCKIYGANGELSLVIPVCHRDLNTKPVSEIQMSFDENWKKIHWRSITSAYRNSPYFDFYEEELEKIFHQDESGLFHFNLEILKLIFKLLDFQPEITFTDKFYTYSGSGKDFRNTFHPKKERRITLKAYHQVFADRYGFIPDLSILDLLCNLGPESTGYLKMDQK